jgi:general secretion pathway protein I
MKLHQHPATAFGFSLLEILVALAILTLSLGVLLQIFSQATRSAHLSRYYSLASAIAEAQLNAAGIDYPLMPGQYDGQTDDADWQWTVTIEPYLSSFDWINDSAPVPIYQVTVTVAQISAQGQPSRQLRLASLRFGTP